MTKLKKCLKVSDHSKCISTGLLVLRIVVGLAFMQHGYGKIQNPMAWMGEGAPVPGFLQLLAALSEFGGGLAWILGLLFPLATFGIWFTMTVAVVMHAIVRQDPFVSTTGGSSYELALVYWSIAFLFFMTGPGRIALDKKVFGSK